MSSLIAKEPESKEFELVPEGVYIARCFKILDLGTQPISYQGEEKDPKRKVAIFWELLDGDMMSDGKPFTMQKTYTLSLDQKATLRADLQAWRGVSFTEEELMGFDLENVLGKYCRMQITHTHKNDKTYANISSIMSMKNSEAEAAPKGVNSNVFFDIVNPDMKAFESLPDYWKEKIESAPEWSEAGKVAQVMAEKDDEEIDLDSIPF